MSRLTAWVGLVALATVASGCNFHPYCINCREGDGAIGTDMDDSFDGSGPPVDGAAGDACVPGSQEVCNGRDDDCDGVVDESAAMVGEVCGMQVGVCTLGTYRCVSGTLECDGAIMAVAENCNGLDDDCDGMTDEGDPGGGVLCGESIGSCVQGRTACRGGTLACDGSVAPVAETCNGRDDDCDGEIDDGNPGGGMACDPGGMGMGMCAAAAQRCVGGTLQCMRVTSPSAETCNLIDDDCDGMTDEDFDLQNSPTHCGRCGNTCTAANARSRCAMGACGIAQCAPGWVNQDGNAANGCEYECSVTGVEICNGRDDDCDREIDEGLTAPMSCFSTGLCAGTRPVCRGSTGWRCVYSAPVSVNPAGDIIPEQDCDDRDNDCNGVIDDAFPMKGRPCTRGLGICQTTGTLVCDTSRTGLTCNAADPGTGRAETCNGLDDDCDGTLDDGAPDEWVRVTTGTGAPLDIYRYEASRPDATPSDGGSRTHRSCSAANRLPWVNVRYGEAEAACTAAGGRLCTEAEWQRACETSAMTACNWSQSGSGVSCNTFRSCGGAPCCNTNEYNASGMPPDRDALVPTGSLASCASSWGGSSVFDLSGNAYEWTRARSSGMNPLRGGSFTTPSAGSTCQDSFVIADDTFLFQNVGFRCCRTP